MKEQASPNVANLDKKGMLLAGLAPAKGSPHTPVQVQKLFFLLDRNIPEWTGGPHFNFEAYHYGPFDRSVYVNLEEMASEGLVEMVAENTWTNYRLTPEGQMKGETIINSLCVAARDYIGKVSEFVRSVTFTELVATIYKAYPDMRAKSVFQG